MGLTPALSLLHVGPLARGSETEAAQAAEGGPSQTILSNNYWSSSLWCSYHGGACMRRRSLVSYQVLDEDLDALRSESSSVGQSSGEGSVYSLLPTLDFGSEGWLETGP